VHDRRVRENVGMYACMHALPFVVVVCVKQICQYERDMCVCVYMHTCSVACVGSPPVELSECRVSMLARAGGKVLSTLGM